MFLRGGGGRGGGKRWVKEPEICIKFLSDIFHIAYVSFKHNVNII